MCPRAIQIEFEFGIRCWFLKRGETEIPKKDFSELEKEREINETQAWIEFTG